ncbi:heme peroxidase [Blyttiomyces helicus]|uniref:Peroxidase n=1 Tax=Blyttiomyces helicus TaxID=388810 RepID=A0A4P9VYZ9_9FUNG|nr:heme peroxidase [Blyttiomyces helicus]|eukprot:RKO84205.1 heme peroxidase [Blyttiomyces helicus]
MRLFALSSFLALAPSALGALHVTDEDYRALIDNTAGFLGNGDGCAGVFDRVAPDRGGGDGSLVNEFNRPDNLGLCHFRIDGFHVQVSTGENVTIADRFALSAIATLQTCDGPTIRWFPGRDDIQHLDSNVTNPVGLLPSSRDSYEVAVRKFKRMGFSKIEMMTVATGSHTVG